MSEPISYELPRVLICEGPEDVSFFKRLIDDRDLPHYHVTHTGKERHTPGGNSRFGEKLQAMSLNMSFRRAVAKILLVTDSDEDQDAAFQNVRNQAQGAGFATPDAVGQIANGRPAVAIITMPTDGPGNLECVLGDAARLPNLMNAAFADHFVNQVATSAEWTLAKKGKLWLRVATAANWPRDPSINIVPMFRDPAANRLVPVEHQSFNPLAQFLIEFAA